MAEAPLRIVQYVRQRAWHAALWLSAGAMAAQALGADNASSDVRQSPYYRGYDFYAGSSDAGTYEDGEIHPWHVQGDIWLLTGGKEQSNVALQIGNSGAGLVNTGTQAMAAKTLAVVRKLSEQYGGQEKALHWIIDTDGQSDHIGGSELLRNAGNTIVGSNETRDNLGLTPGAVVIGSLNLLSRLVADKAPDTLWPNETHIEDVYQWVTNDEAVSIYHPPSATSNENQIVVFRRSDVIVTGDVVSMTTYPIIDVAHGGTIDGELTALNHIIQLAVADRHNGPFEGGTIVIPGHGRLCDQSDVLEYTIVITTIRNRIMYYKNRGKTLQQVEALQPTFDYDERWGSSTGSWTSKQFVDAVYNTLPAKGKAPDRFAMNEPWGG